MVSVQALYAIIPQWDIRSATGESKQLHSAEQETPAPGQAHATPPLLPCQGTSETGAFCTPLSPPAHHTHSIMCLPVGPPNPVLESTTISEVDGLEVVTWRGRTYWLCQEAGALTVGSLLP